LIKKLSKNLRKKLNAFEQREVIGRIYWDDPRWKEVTRLRVNGEDNKANSLVYQIRDSYGVD